ncbi:hypothetical protein [Halocynthiibacter sp.]|uniref:hypothetical protein n=1 Tax=Halocynthiibacter sp. TaxID=1979210 RepID=UPI003C50523E
MQYFSFSTAFALSISMAFPATLVAESVTSGQRTILYTQVCLDAVDTVFERDVAETNETLRSVQAQFTFEYEMSCYDSVERLCSRPFGLGQDCFSEVFAWMDAEATKMTAEMIAQFPSDPELMPWQLKTLSEGMLVDPECESPEGRRPEFCELSHHASHLRRAREARRIIQENDPEKGEN